MEAAVKEATAAEAAMSSFRGLTADKKQELLYSELLAMKAGVVTMRTTTAVSNASVQDEEQSVEKQEEPEEATPSLESPSLQSPSLPAWRDRAYQARV